MSMGGISLTRITIKELTFFLINTHKLFHHEMFVPQIWKVASISKYNKVLSNKYKVD